MTNANDRRNDAVAEAAHPTCAGSASAPVAASTASAAATADGSATLRDRAARKRIGIIGGLGPAASARLYTRITELTDAQCDQEHLQVIVFSCPQIPDRTAYLTGAPGAASFVEPMRNIACSLEAWGCEVIGIPCNTSHARLGEIGAGLSRARIVSMLDAAAAEARAAGVRRPLILATDGTRASGVYDTAIRAAGMEPVWPDALGQDAVMNVIYDQVKAGKPADLRLLSDVCARARAGEAVAAPVPDGADAADARTACDGIVLGCTELSTIGFGAAHAGMPVVDALDALARACIAAAGARIRR